MSLTRFRCANSLLYISRESLDEPEHASAAAIRWSETVYWSASQTVCWPVRVRLSTDQYESHGQYESLTVNWPVRSRPVRVRLSTGQCEADDTE